MPAEAGAEDGFEADQAASWGAWWPPGGKGGGPLWNPAWPSDGGPNDWAGGGDMFQYYNQGAEGWQGCWPGGGWDNGPWLGDGLAWGGSYGLRGGRGAGAAQMQGPGYWMRGRSHNHVPRRVNLAERFNQKASDEETTTLMIRNVPNQYHRGLLMQELNSLGFRDKYDFIYLPMDNATHWNVGYAFVNFEDPADAAAFMQVMHGHEFRRYYGNGKRRVAQVSRAHIQGLEANLAHCSSTSVLSMYALWRPWVKPNARAHIKGDLSHFDSTEDDDSTDLLGPQPGGNGKGGHPRKADGRGPPRPIGPPHGNALMKPLPSMASSAPAPGHPGVAQAPPHAHGQGALNDDVRGISSIAATRDRQVSRTPSPTIEPPNQSRTLWGPFTQSQSPLLGPTAISPVLLPQSMPQRTGRSRSPSASMSPHAKAMQSPQLAAVALPASALSPQTAAALMSPMMAPMLRPPTVMDAPMFGSPLIGATCPGGAHPLEAALLRGPPPKAAELDGAAEWQWPAAERGRRP